MVKKGIDSGTILTGLWIAYGMDLDCLLGDLHGWIGDKTRAGITGAF